MKKNIIAFYPYSFDINAYHGMIQEMISEKYFVIDYRDLRNGIFHLHDVAAIYLNWIEEDVMSMQDRQLITDARVHGIRVYWVFHNRVTHDSHIEKQRRCRSNIIFLIQNVSDIIILSHASIQYLYEYVADLNESKIHYLAHQNYIGNYGALEDKRLKGSFDQTKFVFGCIGTIRSDKNIELTIKAFQQFSYNQDCVLIIVGASDSESYMETLKGRIGEAENIFMIPNRIPDYMMNFYVQSADIILLPYDLQAYMNSGVMLLAFTNSRTVITSNISMAEEFDDKLIYKYSYDSEEEHMNQLLFQMERAYTEGKEIVKEKGKRLFQEVLVNHAKDKVKQELFRILEDSSLRSQESERIEGLCMEYGDKNNWRMRYYILDAWVRDMISGHGFIQRLKESNIEKIAILGYGKCGKMLFTEMERNGLRIACIIDRNAKNIHAKVRVCTLEDLREALDMVIVTIAEADMKMVRRICCGLNANCYVLNLKDI